MSYSFIFPSSKKCRFTLLVPEADLIRLSPNINYTIFLYWYYISSSIPPQNCRLHALSFRLLPKQFRIRNGQSRVLQNFITNYYHLFSRFASSNVNITTNIHPIPLKFSLDGNRNKMISMPYCRMVFHIVLNLFFQRALSCMLLSRQDN